MPTIQVNFTPPNPAPSEYIVKYRVKGTNSAYTTLTPNPVGSPVVITGVAFNTEYEGTIKGGCGQTAFSTEIAFSTCTCPTGYTVSTDKNRCERIETTPPTITQSNYCLAPSANPAYSQYFTRIYNSGFSSSSIGLSSAPSGDVYAELHTDGLWANLTASSASGPMNFDAVWIDSDCDGIKNSLAPGAEVTIAYAYENEGSSRTVYVGVAADNQFALKVNGTVVAQTTNQGAAENFRIWHIFPVTINQGFNDFNVVGTGDGTINDAVAMVVYDNTATQIQNAGSRSDLNILFATHQLFGTMINVATCPLTYSLDTSQGVGNYICRKVTTIACTGVIGNSNPVPPLISSALVQDATTVALTMSKNMLAASISGWSVGVNGSSDALSGVQIQQNNKLIFTLNSDVHAGDTVTISYNALVGGTVDYQNMELETISNFPITNSLTTTNFTAHWGFKDVSGPLTQSQIEASLLSGSFVDGANVVADFTSNHDFKYLWMAEPVAQPIKIKTSTPLGDENIGSSGTYNTPTTVSGTYRFYITQAQTIADSETTIFKIS